MSESPGLHDVTKAPAVSVIMCSFQRAHVLTGAIESILDQTFTNFELIVVDDGSTDGTADVVRQVEDPRVRLVINEKNLGHPASRNEGIIRARGRFLAFLDDDDRWTPTKLEVQVDALEQHSDCGVAWSYAAWKSPDGSLSVRNIDLDGDVSVLLQRTDVVLMQCLLLRSSAIEEIGLFDPALVALDDYEFSLRMARVCRFVTVPEVVVIMHTTPGSISLSLEQRANMAAYLLDKPNTLTDRRARSRWMVRRSSDLLQLGRKAEWRQMLLEAVHEYPWSLRPWVMFAAGLLGGSAPDRLARFRNHLSRRLRHRPLRTSLRRQS